MTGRPGLNGLAFLAILCLFAAQGSGQEKNERRRIAIVLDDSGNRLDLVQEIIRSRVKVTLSILPRQEVSLETDRMASDAGLQVFLHLPMEPLGKEWTLDPELSILCGMTPFQIVSSLCEALRSAPHAIGVNNHMGSKATQDKKLMRRLMVELKRTDLLFLDSESVDDSIAAATARQLKIPTAVRSVFLDNVDDYGAIKDQLMSLVKMNSGSVGIGHLRPTTVKVLVETMPSLSEQGIDWVFCSEVMGAKE